MPVKEVSAVSNPVVKSIRALGLRKGRERQGAFLAEGLKLVVDAVERGWTVRTLVVARDADASPERQARVDALAARIHASGGLVLRASRKVLEAVAKRDNPQAVMAVIEERRLAPDAIRPERGACWLALDRCRDPGNLGSAIRTADALGAAGVILIGPSTDPFDREAVRATMGSLFHVPVAAIPTEGFAALAERFRARGGQVVGTHLEGAVDHRAVDWRRSPVLLAMGNEREGLDPALAPLCDRLALIAMRAGRGADSLNLAVSTGIVLFEARRHVLEGGASDGEAPVSPRKVPQC